MIFSAQLSLGYGVFFVIGSVLFSTNVFLEKAARLEFAKTTALKANNIARAAYCLKFLLVVILVGGSAWLPLAHFWQKIVLILVVALFLYLLEQLTNNKVTAKNSEKLLKSLNWLASLASFICWPLLKVSVPKNDNSDEYKEDTKGFTQMVATLQKQRINSQLDQKDVEMISGVLSLHDKPVHEIMVPRTDAFMVDITNDNDRNIDSILEMEYSRIPVYHEDKDNIVGIVHTKNLLKYARRYGFEHVTLRQVMHPAFFVPETMTVDELLLQMKKTQNQLAILLDEYGGVVGLVTLEDLIEEIVGEIEDESDEPIKNFRQLSEHKYIVQGKMTLSEFNDKFQTDLTMDDVDTIAGYIIAKAGKIPDDDDTLTVKTEEGLVLQTLKVVDDARITQVLVLLPKKSGTVD